MNPAQRWSRVSEILSRALDLPESQRTAFLTEAIGREPELRTEVLALFGELRRTEGFLEPPPAAADPAVATGADGAFGPYRVLGVLGEGGMGVVYLAERSDGQFTRRVAIKRVASARPGADALRRFHDERQILAALDHPNIARLIDAGFDAAGVPYLVMEHVEGVPITAHCRENGLGVAARLALFLKVCAAVQHAHQNLVIHRDVKPGNILVTPSGEPKLLDFGIARMAAPSDEATRTMNRALTLDYASPEQVRGEPVTTASDVYALGILLYELLADAKAYTVGERSLAEALRLVCETVPAPPSAAAPAGRRGELAGDLDSIVRKAIEKAPADRYGSVAELAADVAAHRDHLPVKARRLSFAYVGRKFVRRHRGAAVAAAALAALVAAGVAAVLWQARTAERERARAQQRFDQVRQLAHYVIFDLQDGITPLAGSTELRRQMVERSLGYLDSLAADSAGDPRLQMELAEAYARLGSVLGRTSAANLGDRPGAVKSYGKARDLMERVVALRPGDADARRSLARLLLSINELNERPDVAAKALERSTALWQDLMREDPAREDNIRGAASAAFSASNAAEESDPAQAALHMERALVLFQKLLAAKPNDLDRKRNVALSHKYLAALLIDARDPTRAYPHTAEAARLDGERVAAEPQNAQAKMDYTIDLGMLAQDRLRRGDYIQALSRYQEVLALRRELWQADRANVHARYFLAHSLTRVAEMHVYCGRAGLARPLLDEALEHARAIPEQEGQILMVQGKMHLLLGEVANASGQDPCPSYRRMSDLLARVPAAVQTSYLDEPRIQALRNRALVRARSCPK